MNRFRATELSREQWYRKLSPIFKCAWNFLCDECDNAGMWAIDNDALDFYVGAPVNLDAFIDAVNQDRKEVPRIEWFGTEKLWLTGFCAFQYKVLSYDCVPHKKIIELLQKYTLLDRVPVKVPNTVISRVPGTHKEKTIQGKDKEKENTGTHINELFGPEDVPETPETPKPAANSRQNAHKRQNLAKVEKEAGVTMKDYEAIVAAVKAAEKLNEQKVILADFISSKRPAFIEPYLDIWNLFVVGTDLAEAHAASDARTQKIKTRLKEPAFDFVKILTEIKKAPHCLGQNDRGWKVDFDWIIENEKQYVRIIEGRYKNGK